VNDVPFGFDRPRDDDDDRNRPGPGQGSGDSPKSGPQPGGQGPFDPGNPFAALLGGIDPTDMGAAFQRLGQLLSNESGPVNWQMAREVARQALATPALGAGSGTDPAPGRPDGDGVEQAVRLAELWLDTVTAFPPGTTATAAWSRAEWVEATLPVWKQLVEPVAAQVVEAMAQVVPAEMQAMTGPLLGVMRSMGGAVFGVQVGQALGTLASEVVASTDVGLPIGPPGRAALLPTNVAAFGSGLGIDEEQVRLYLALREAAHHRLFGHVPWLRGHLLGAVEGYAKGIRVDTERLEEVVGQLDPGNPEAIQEALSSGMFAPEQTPAQRVALARLETALALVEGWVDTVVDAAAADRLPASAALRETVRRRRATGGPAEQTFATLVGLELRPRRLRDAAALWTLLTQSRGSEGRDAVWGHPDLLPTAEDLDDPKDFVDRTSGGPDSLEGLGLDHPEGPDDPGGRPPGGGPGDPRPS
jgi:putative hydrolase